MLNAYENIVSLGASKAHEERTASMKRLFEKRTGAFGPNDSWFEVRSRAFWDDALTTQGFARSVEVELDDSARRWVVSFERAHRGLFRVVTCGALRVLQDVWSGAEFPIGEVDDGLRDALERSSGLFDARVVASYEPVRLAVLPGAIFHPEDATEAILNVLETARKQQVLLGDVFDALLRMELSLRTLSRVRVGFAYRPDALREGAPVAPVGR